ncbi:hypothetical protein F5X99DRAFT_362244 [Biscogniauxia marginata]|nr:hypothetical protein F5X99DRAFT_362244 [Biscogniauxia marginata]
MDAHLNSLGNPHSDVQAPSDNSPGHTQSSSAESAPQQHSDVIPPNTIPLERRLEAERAAQAHRAATRTQNPPRDPHRGTGQPAWHRVVLRYQGSADLSLEDLRAYRFNDGDVDEPDTEDDTEEEDYDEAEDNDDEADPADDDGPELDNPLLAQRRSFPVTLNSSAWRPPKVECTICQDDFTDKPKSVRRLICGHSHCDDCIKANAHSALDSAPFSPAKCCHVIPRETLTRAGAFTDDEAKRYSNKMEELTNPHYKLYCWGEGCGAFIPLANQKKRVGECEQCGKKTCKTCRQKSHFGGCDQEKLQELRNSEDLVYKLAGNKGWKRCPNCLNIVQKHGGCNHMACHCGQGFCYACGQAVSAEQHVCSKESEPV